MTIPSPDPVDREIGGYFELEMAHGHGSLHPNSSLTLKSGRSCLGLLIEATKPSRVWVPYYICDGAVEPLISRSVPVEYYEVDDELRPVGPLPELENDERFIYVNYFGLKTNYADTLEYHYRGQLWLDQVQAFFVVPDEPLACHYNSARKFFGVPDGAHLYWPRELDPLVPVIPPTNADYRVDHLLLRLAGETDAGRQAFQENEDLNGGPTALISSLGAAMLDRIDYARCRERRRSNYRRLHEALGPTNQLSANLLTLADDATPFCYPFLPASPIEKEYFWERRIYVPHLWSECATRSKAGYEWEKRLSRDLLPLPVDQRYEADDMDRIIATIRDHDGR